MHIAYFSPLPPQRSGIADYSAELLPYLAQHADVELFIDEGYSPSPEIVRHFPVHSYRRFPSLVGEGKYDVFLYHMGNHATYHEYIYHTLLEHPGIVVLHEYVFQDFFRGITLPSGDTQRYVDEMRYCYGEIGTRVAQISLETNRTPDPEIYPLFERIVDSSLGIIIHSEYVRKRVHESRPRALCSKVNHHLFLGQLSTEVANTSSERLSLNLPPNAFVVGSFGFMSSSKRLEVSLRAFARFHRQFPGTVYLLVGKTLPSFNMDHLIRSVGVEKDAVILTGYVDKETFLRYMATIDLALNLRFPTCGETSGAVIRLMGLGKPVIVSNAGSFAEYPDDCCVKIDIDEMEEEMLLTMMRALATDEELRDQIGINAQEYIQTYHTLEKSAQGYIDFVREVMAWPPKILAKVPPLAKPAEGDVLSGLITDVATELVDLGIDERDEEVLAGIAQDIATLGGNP